MQKTTLSIFANFRIDSEERLLRLKDSFLSFCAIDAEKWVVNIRGQYKDQAREFLEAHLDSRLVMFQLESHEGWFHDSRIMLQEITSDYVLYWIEDHINMVPDYNIYANIIEEMREFCIEFLPYSFFWTTKRYENIKQQELQNISWLDLDASAFNLLQQKAPKAYIIFAVGIFSNNLFKRLIQTNDCRQAITWPNDTPFNFEKSWHDTHWLPVRIGLPKHELFASIDDDSVEPGSCLISRGVYASRQLRQYMGDSENYKPIPEVTLTTLNQQRDPNSLIQRLMSANIPVARVDLDVDDFISWLNDYREVQNHYATMNDVYIEKCLEHYIAYKFSEVKPEQAYIDIAASASNWADSLLKRGVNAYSLDLMYQEGIHGNKIGADAAATGLPDSAVDAMSLQCAFETFQGNNDRLFVKEAKRILKPGGKVVITPLYLDVRHFILSSKNTDLSCVPLDEGAIRVWREDEYDEAFSRHYSPEALAGRIFANLDGLNANVIYINNLDQIRQRFPGQHIYCDFSLYLSKPEQIAVPANKMSHIYDEKFYLEQKDASYKSAETIVPMLLDVFKSQSVIDIGCGVGGWLHVFQKNGVADITGYDVNQLDAANYFVDRNRINTNIDLSDSNFKIHERSDLLICLEVAEHLPAAVADQFILNLTTASPVIVFSAALPGQTGVNHVNEQPPWYWREKFNRAGFVEIDFIRPQILRNEDVCWWYRQNITCFVRSGLLLNNPELAALSKIHGQTDDEHRLTVVNEWVLKQILNGEHLKNPPAGLQKEKLFLSVIIPTRNRAALLYNALESITGQTYPANCFEVIVVDNGSTDSTAEVCQHFQRRIPNFRHIHDARVGLHNGRHTGMGAAKGEILVYADDDIEAVSSWLEGVAESFEDPQVALVGGKILPKFESLPPYWVSELTSTTDLGWSLGWYSILDFGDTVHEIPPEYVWGCNFSIRKNVLKKIGGFHPDALPQELIRYRGDGETSVSVAVRDMGLKALYNPKAAVYHVVSSNRLTTDYVYQRAFNQGISDSYTSIRKTRALSPPMQYDQSSKTIQETVNRGIVDGFNYHQQMVQSDNKLQEWVFRNHYLNEQGIIDELHDPGPFKPYLKKKNVEGVPFDFWIGDTDGRDWYDLQCGDPVWIEMGFIRDHLVRENDVVLECGGHHGCTAIVLSRWVGPGGKVITFEALPANCDTIEKNIKLNGLKNVTLERKAVGAGRGVISVNASSNSSVDFSGTGIQVEMTCLDEYEHLKPDFVKIDVEGFEMQVLQGAAKILSRRPRLAIELHTESLSAYGATVQDIFRLIDIEKYKVWVQWEDGQQPVEYDMKTPITKRVHLFCMQLTDNHRKHRGL